MIINTKMAREAADTLGVPLDGLTKDIVNAHYKRRARVTHPDAGGSVEAFAAVDRAKHVLHRWLDRQGPPVEPTVGARVVCHTCQGKGFLMRPSAFRQMRVACPGCRGSGELGVEHEKGE